MLGVVIWSCQTTGKAIIWCADHGDLAHFDGAGSMTGAVMVSAGDLVDVTLMRSSAVRRCARLELVEAGYMPEIADHLRTRPRAIAAA
ncbi:hypothetical protein GCM10011452_03430 [Gemmobacter lanyuensis]|uniref:Uncharacterized protein n=1 Tax=Gemmobacter lanyuensis TaxID=1054497 RepID=A0A918INT7_9RHOB|nr:hypothetical protein [Gemmobacter lanyuensis]GGW21717.1 hypothetical protein GCM10011452_03430 [Gemmobacter lanyuensis]